MLFCHTYIVPFAHERIKHMGIYFPRNFVTTAEHFVMVEPIKYLGRYMTKCLILSCGKEAIYEGHPISNANISVTFK